MAMTKICTTSNEWHSRAISDSSMVYFFFSSFIKRHGQSRHLGGFSGHANMRSGNQGRSRKSYWASVLIKKSNAGIASK